jgi:hypothetical protein
MIDLRRDREFFDQSDLFSYAERVRQQDESKVIDTKKKDYGGSASRSEMLCRLKQGPLSCVDAEYVVHRGQAVIGSLRDRGHRIDTSVVDGQLAYVYHGFRATVKVSKSMQEAYYRTGHWISLARQRKEIDGKKCVQCGAKDDLETHHWRYNLFAESLENDLITFCKPCHAAIHIAVSGSSVHFPRRVDESIAARLRGEA